MDRRNRFLVCKSVHKLQVAQRNILRDRCAELPPGPFDISFICDETSCSPGVEEAAGVRLKEKIIQPGNLDASRSVQSEKEREQQHADIELRGYRCALTKEVRILDHWKSFLACFGETQFS